MVQNDKMREKYANDGGSVVGQYNEYEEVATTSSFVTALDVDARGIREALLIIHNNAGGDLDYQVLGNIKQLEDIVDPTGTDDDDKGWVVISSASAATNTAPDVIALNSPYTRYVVQIKHTSLTTNVDIWFRGTT
ncbi:MAG: hypothetical protein H8D23_05180 [Candidatus Brocadiales bacterium]|nr:hypothetical protein [Candidatus Brocadiales bacterium]